jgi:hypothetical protein
MKLTKLDESLKAFNGEDLLIKTSADSDKLSKMTYKDALLNCLGTITPENGKESINAYRLACDIMTKEGDFGVSVEDLLLLKKSVEQNNAKFGIIIQGQILEYIEKVDKADKE